MPFGAQSCVGRWHGIRALSVRTLRMVRMAMPKQREPDGPPCAVDYLGGEPTATEPCLWHALAPRLEPGFAGQWSHPRIRLGRLKVNLGD